MNPGTPPELEAVLQRARSAWPGLVIPPARFHAYLLERCAAALPDPMRAQELYLACACAEEVPLALETFERQFLVRLIPTIVRVQDSSAFVDEVMQALRRKLFLAEGDADKRILEFSGRGPLLGWLRVVALRTALKLHHTAVPSEPLTGDEAERLPTAAQEPELELLRLRHQEAFNNAFVQAVAALEPDERTVLRLYTLEQLNVARIGALFQVDRSTVSRWILRARSRLLELTRKSLREQLDLRPSELDSLIRALRSGLDVSLARHLGPP